MARAHGPGLGLECVYGSGFRAKVSGFRAASTNRVIDVSLRGIFYTCSAQDFHLCRLSITKPKLRKVSEDMIRSEFLDKGAGII